MLEYVREMRFPREFRVGQFLRPIRNDVLARVNVDQAARWAEDWVRSEGFKAVANWEVFTRMLLEILTGDLPLQEDSLVQIAIHAWQIRRNMDVLTKAYGMEILFKNLEVNVRNLYEVLAAKHVEIQDPEGEVFSWRNDFRPLARKPHPGKEKIFLEVQEPAVYLNGVLKREGLYILGIPEIQAKEGTA